jgi:DNA-binding NarL/FixJ family response regulator
MYPYPWRVSYHDCFGWSVSAPAYSPLVFHLTRCISPKSPKPMPSRILLADPVLVVQNGMRAILKGEDDLEVCRVVGSAPEAHRAIRRSAPDLVITSLSLEDTGGLDFVEDLRASHPDLPVLVFGRYDQAEIAKRALAVGADGYVPKSAPTETLIESLHRVIDGDTYVA